MGPLEQHILCVNVKYKVEDDEKKNNFIIRVVNITLHPSSQSIFHTWL